VSHRIKNQPTNTGSQHVSMVEQHRRHSDPSGHPERRETTDQRRFDRTDTAGSGRGGGEGAADHRHHGDGDERGIAAERRDAGP
jgi:hypothetical protein